MENDIKWEMVFGKPQEDFGLGTKIGKPQTRFLINDSQKELLDYLVLK